MNRTYHLCWVLVLLGLLSMTSSPAMGDDGVDPFFVPRPESYRRMISPTPSMERQEQDSRNLFLQLGVDFKNVFTTKENLVIMGAGLGAAWGASHFDQDVAASGFNSELRQGGALDPIFESGEILGDGWVQAGAAFATYGLGKLFRAPEVASLGRDLVRAQVVTVAITFGVKTAVGRERPDGSSQTSFPSGHTSGTFATATVLQRRYGWKVGIPAYAVAGYVAGSRLNEARHYLSDVIFGAAIGIMVGRTVTIGIADNRFAIGPMLAPGGAGVQFTWLGSNADSLGRPR